LTKVKPPDKIGHDRYPSSYDNNISIIPTMRIHPSSLAIIVSIGLLGIGQTQTPEVPPAPQLPTTPSKTTVGTADLLAGKRVMILGDSITQDGTYVSYLEYFLTKQYPERSFDIINVGLSSETASGLSEVGHAGGSFPRPCVHERLQRSLDAVKPQRVVACYGMNDGIYQPYSEAIMKAFQDGITKLADSCRAAGAQLILVTPPVFEGGAYDEVLGKFSEWEVAHPPKGVIAVADLHTSMAAARAERRKASPDFRFTNDNVHPSELGHVVMAQSILQGLGIPMPQGKAEDLLAAAHADPLFSLVCKHRSTRSNGWLNHIGYTRERTVAPKTGDIEAVEASAKQIQTTINKMIHTP